MVGCLRFPPLIPAKRRRRRLMQQGDASGRSAKPGQRRITVQKEGGPRDLGSLLEEEEEDSCTARNIVFRNISL
jgi:hypothetical protein